MLEGKVNLNMPLKGPELIVETFTKQIQETAWENTEQRTQDSV